MKTKLKPLWVRRIIIVLASPIAFGFYLGYVSEPKNNVEFSFKDFIKGMRFFWDIK